jgi:chromosome segregation ATPase
MADTISPRSTTKSPASGSSRRTAGAAKAPRARSASTGAGRSRAKTRAGSANRSARGAAVRTTRSTTDRVGDYAERAVLIPVGAALVARERVATSVSDALSSYSTPTKAQAQLRKFERRGSTARSRLEREVRKTRTRVERELRERRRELEERRDSLTKSLSAQVEQTQSQIEKAQAQIEEAVRARLEDSTDFASRLQERVLRLV